MALSQHEHTYVSLTTKERAMLDLLLNTLKDVLPIVGIIFFFQYVIIRKPIAHLPQVLLGFGFVIVGLTLFLLGLEQALFPLGKLMATQLSSAEFLGVAKDSVDHHWSEYYWVYLFAFAIGASTTIAEPSLIAVAIKAEQVSGGTIQPLALRLAVALGVAIGIALGTWRIVVGYPIHWFIIAGYILVVVQTFFAPKLIIPLAYDSGGVTTSTVTVPIVAALGLGLAGTVPGRSVLLDGFGLIAFASLFPIISLMGYAQIVQWLNNRKKTA